MFALAGSCSRDRSDCLVKRQEDKSKLKSEAAWRIGQSTLAEDGYSKNVSSCRKSPEGSGALTIIGSGRWIVGLTWTAMTIKTILAKVMQRLQSFENDYR